MITEKKQSTSFICEIPDYFGIPEKSRQAATVKRVLL